MWLAPSGSSSTSKMKIEWWQGTRQDWSLKVSLK
jgi:hypothetical protein